MKPAQKWMHAATGEFESKPVEYDALNCHWCKGTGANQSSAFSDLSLEKSSEPHASSRSPFSRSALRTAAFVETLLVVSDPLKPYAIGKFLMVWKSNTCVI